MFKSAKSASWTFLKAKQPNDIGLLYYWLWSVSLGMTGEFEINTCKSCLWERWDKHGIENRLHDKEHVKTLFTFWRSDKICCELQSHVSCEGFWVMSCVSRLMPPLSPTIFHLAASWPGWANCCEATLLTLLTSVKLLSHPSCVMVQIKHYQVKRWVSVLPTKTHISTRTLHLIMTQ